MKNYLLVAIFLILSSCGIRLGYPGGYDNDGTNTSNGSCASLPTNVSYSQTCVSSSGLWTFYNVRIFSDGTPATGTQQCDQDQDDHPLTQEEFNDAYALDGGSTSTNVSSNQNFVSTESCASGSVNVVDNVNFFSPSYTDLYIWRRN